MRRREFISLFSGAVVGWPLTSRAQQSATPVIGLLSSGSRESYSLRLSAFLQGLKDIGYVEGQNVSIQYRWAAGPYDQLNALARRLGSPTGHGDFRDGRYSCSPGPSRDLNNSGRVHNWW
jgi:putative ABC transport system substrate-binding protein